MSCYTRHLKEDLATFEISLGPVDREAIDGAIHDYVGVEYKECAATWSKAKGLLADEAAREALLAAVGEAVES